MSTAPGAQNNYKVTSRNTDHRHHNNIIKMGKFEIVHNLQKCGTETPSSANAAGKMVLIALLGAGLPQTLDL